MFYKENGIRNLRPDYTYTNKHSEAELFQKQLAFVMRLVDLLQAEKTVVYIDETSFSLWHKKSRMWMPLTSRFKIVLN